MTQTGSNSKFDLDHPIILDSNIELVKLVEVN